MFKLRSARRSSKEGKQGVILKILFFIFVLATIIAIITFLRSDILKVKNIYIKPERLSCAGSTDLKRQIDILNSNLFLLNDENIKKKLKAKFLCIDQITFRKQFPSQIYIAISERKPVLTLQKVYFSKINITNLESTASSQAASLDFNTEVSSDTGKFLVDEGSFIFAKSFNLDSDLLNIYIADEQISVGKTLSNGVIKKVLTITKRLAEIPLAVGKIKIDDNKILVDGDFKLAFSVIKDLDYQLASLHLILQKAKMDSREVIEMIDLRFDKPVVKYSPKMKPSL